jgi:hypothetical protein
MNRFLRLSYCAFIGISLLSDAVSCASLEARTDKQSGETHPAGNRHSIKVLNPPTHPHQLPRFKLQPTQNLTGWSIENSLNKKGISTDQKENSSSGYRFSNLEFSDSSFDDLYSLKVEFSQKVETEILEQNSTFSVKLFKNPLALSGVGVPALDEIYGLSNPPTLAIPSPFTATDFISQKNALQFTIQHEASLADRFSFVFFSEVYPKISDLSAVPKWPTLDPQDGDTFNLGMEASYQIDGAISAYSFVNREGNDVLDLELGLSYQINDIVSVYSTIGRSLFPTSRSGEIDDTGKLGLSLSLFGGKLETSLSLYITIANNVEITDENNSGAIASVGQYTRQGFELGAYGSPAPGWDLEFTYTFADTNQPDAAKHIMELEIVYKIAEGALKGLGVASSVYLESGFTARRGGTANSDNIEASAGVFYVGNGYSAALRLENLFVPKDLALIGSVIFRF